MARPNPHEEQWARMVGEAATAWGHAGRWFHDRKRHVVTFVGLGDVALDDPDGRITGYAPEAQRDQMTMRCHQLLARHFHAPAEWVTGDEERDQHIRRALLGVRERPTSARDHERVARYGRELGIAGWEERWKWAADRYIHDGIEHRLTSAVVRGAVMWNELGHPERAVAPADLVIRNWQADGPDQDVAAVYDTDLHDFVICIWWRDGRAAVAALVERRPDFDGNSWVEAFALAALAAETGLLDELSEQVARLEQLMRVADREAGAFAALEWHDRRHLLAVARSWLAALVPDQSVAQPSGDVGVGPATAARTTSPVAARGVTGLTWRGDVLVAVTADGELAVDAGGGRTLAPPPAVADDPPPDRVRVDGTAVVLELADGTVIPLRREWDEDRLEEADTYEVTRSPDEQRLAVWGEYGPIFVFGVDGSPAGEFNDHAKGPTYGVEFGSGRMMSWARDGRAVVYDLDRRLVVGAVQLDGWPEDAALHRDGRIVATYDNVAHWLAHDIDTGERLGPARPARHAILHPTRPLIGWADDEQVWVEEYGRPR